MTTAVIYARKSKATDKGESTENHINKGISLCKLRGWDYAIYEAYYIFLNYFINNSDIRTTYNDKLLNY